jgi:DNA-binding transcriptional ArsR family regulator
MITNHSRAIPQKWHDIARVFEALGDEQRQRIILSFEPKERLNVGQISEGSRLSRSTVSHHLKVLHDAGALKRQKIGKEVYYWINKPFLEKSFGNVMDYLRDYV